MKYATEKQLINAIREGDYSWLGWQFWNAFVTLPKNDKTMKYHTKIWNNLTKKQQKKCESE